MKAGATRQKRQFYEFGPFRVDRVKRRILRDGHPVALTPKAFDTLIALLEHKGQALEKEELIEAVWPETAVEENNLTQNIYALRKALGDSHNQSRYIVTIPGWGYQFVADVREVTGADSELIAEERTRTRIVIEEEETREKNELDKGRLGSTAVANSDYLGITGAKPASIFLRLIAGKRAPTLVMLVVVAGAVILTVLQLQRYITEKNASQRAVAGVPNLDKTKLTSNTDARRAAISPDGKYVVYTERVAGRETLWLRPVAVANSQPIIPSSEARYFGLAFSPDGNYLYFVRSEKDEPVRALYRMPAFGGASKKLLADLEDLITLSPDGDRICFVRNSQAQGESALMIASAEGTQEQKLASHDLATPFWSPSWSPDGRLIVCAVGTADTGSSEMSLVELTTDGGSERPITSQKWEHIGQVAWLVDGRGLVMAARQQGSTLSRLWYLSYPEAEVRGITDDSNYLFLSLAADSKCLAAVQRFLTANIWILPDGDAGRAYQTAHAVGGFSWTPDRRIVYASGAGGNHDVWIMNADGSGQRQLTADAGKNASPTVSRNGRHIVFVSDRTGAFHIWRMNIDGSDTVQLTHGRGENVPAISPDGRWVVYTSASDWTLWKVPIDGGEPVRLADEDSCWPTVSPDGKWIAYFKVEGSPHPKYKVAVIPFEGGKPVKLFDAAQNTPPSLDVRWTPDGEGLAYTVNHNDVSNIWIQPLDGSPRRQMSNFASDQIFSFTWSLDGKHLACERGGWKGDIVLIRNLR